MRLSVTQREAVRDIVAICSLDLDSRALRARIADRLRRVIPQDAFCFGTIDPWTLLITDEVSDGIPSAAAAPAARNEYLVEDVDKFAVLARSSRTVAILGQSTGGDPEASHRLRSVLPVIDARHELRAVFVADGRCWGAVALFRNGGRPDFTQSDADLVQAVSVPVAVALRRAACRPGAAVGVSTDPGGPGVLLVDRGGGVLAANEAGRRRLDDLSPHRMAVHEVAAAARAGHGSAAHARVRSRTGRWLSLWGSPFDGGHEGDVSVVIQVAPTSEISQLLMLAYALSPREREVLQRVIAGMPSAGIAADLHISASTVQDHLKSLFAKVGVRSRGRLVSHILGEHYLPQAVR
ncbi:LuxR family transcriptional regulator [Nonomuraea fuscirosea]|uniref:LuxR family transcriptional regulator n=1 Tax=Nonomuraea fuscirosea TaxID=1291556 RepID=A0A2T0MXD1_9ACTN|nr:LuxR C-terminal-related transcriptional regulator [Nonomuraea fuscirosea]PRX63734.1 LuxR family transcriptional regulator [Nonomuraea fuscirosea]